MAEELSNQEKTGKLETENDFIKMKLMLEHGAKFGPQGLGGCPPEIENEFLKSIMAFEELYRNRKMITVFERLGQPSQFRPCIEIPAEEFREAWNDLLNYMHGYGIDLDVCSPYIGAEELYRFTVEELFKEEIDDIELPGWTTSFIYDEFHPDPIYESERSIQHEFFPGIFSPHPLDQYFNCLDDKDLLVNGKRYATPEDLLLLINRFKSFYNRIELELVSIDQCRILENKHVMVIGNYKANADTADEHSTLHFSGGFAAELVPNDIGFLNIKCAQVEGIDFG